MAVASNRSVTVIMEDDVQYNQEFSSSENITSPGAVENKTLASGYNELTVPDGAKGVTIIFPTGNTTAVTLKGVTGDTGIALHLTDPTSIGLSNVTTFGLTAAAEIENVRLIYT